MKRHSDEAPTSEHLGRLLPRRLITKATAVVLVASGWITGVSSSDTAQIQVRHITGNRNSLPAELKKLQPATKQRILRVMNANIHGWETVDGGGSNVGIFWDAVRTVKPDVICMQESNDYGINASQEWHQMPPDMNYVSAQTRTFGLSFDTEGEDNAILSTSMLVHPSVKRLPAANILRWLTEPRDALSAELQLADGTKTKIQVTTTHLSTFEDEQPSQFSAFDAFAKHETPPGGIVIECGDTNLGLTTKLVWNTTSGPTKTRDLYKTFPSWGEQLEPFDRIRSNCVIINTSTVLIGSDHLGLVEDIDLGRCVDAHSDW